MRQTARIATESSLAARHRTGGIVRKIRRVLPSVTVPHGVKVLLVGISVYALTTFLVFGGAFVGWDRMRPDGLQLGEGQLGDRFVDMLCQWDGQSYSRIALDGYAFERGRASSVAFFPLYPLLGRTVGKLTGMSSQIALLVISHVCLILSLMLFLEYGRLRMDAGVGRSGWHAVVLLAVFPVGLFMRVAYTESLFLFLCLLALYGMERRWCGVGIAVIIGLATAARPPGVALLVPLMIHVWTRRGSACQAVASLSYLLPIACGGLFAYMLYLWCAFGEPLGFAQAQQHIRMMPRVGLWEHTLILVSGEPLWSPYWPSSVGNWSRFDTSAWLSLQFANPVYFVAAAFLLYLGTFRRWLTALEASFGATLLLVGYVTRSYDMCMASQARFVLVIFPIYIVMERLLVQCPIGARIGVVLLFALYLFAYSVMWGAGRLVI